MSNVSNAGESLGVIDGKNEVVVNYDLSLDEMIALGEYEEDFDKNITAEHFPFEGRGECNFLVARFHFNKEMNSDDIIAAISRQGYRPVGIEVLLTIGAQCFDLRCKSQIVGLGSVSRFQVSKEGPVGDFMPTLWRYPDTHSLGLCWYTRSWSVGVQFAAVRK